MYSFLAAIKPASAYEWFTYSKGAPIELDFRGKPVTISKGQKFGVRKSASGKNIRLVLPNEITKVFTITLDQAKALAKGVGKG